MFGVDARGVYTERWETRADGSHYCHTHKVEVDLAEVCLDCVVEGDVTAESDDDLELAKREAEWLTMARRLDREAKKILDVGLPREFPTAAKLIAEASKRHRLAADNREKRAQRAHERMAIEHERQMAGLRGSH